jgi:hypothetical protein
LKTLYGPKTESNELGWSRTKNIKCLSWSHLSTLKNINLLRLLFLSWMNHCCFSNLPKVGLKLHQTYVSFQRVQHIKPEAEYGLLGNLYFNVVLNASHSCLWCKQRERNAWSFRGSWECEFEFIIWFVMLSLWCFTIANWRYHYEIKVWFLVLFFPK